MAIMPKGLSFLEAAVVPVSGLTAWQALEPGMPLAGKQVLIHAGAGGVGAFAVQVRPSASARCQAAARLQGTGLQGVKLPG